MPRIFRTSFFAVIIATIAFFVIGTVWYGLVFEEQWLETTGMTAIEADRLLEQTGMAQWLFWALLITLAQAIGILMVIHKNGAKSMKACLETTFWVLVTFVAPILAYANVYKGLSLTGFLIDFGHLSIGYLSCAAIYALYRTKSSKRNTLIKI